MHTAADWSDGVGREFKGSAGSPCPGLRLGWMMVGLSRAKVKWTLRYRENLGRHRNVSVITLGVTIKT